MKPSTFRKIEYTFWLTLAIATTVASFWAAATIWGFQ